MAVTTRPNGAWLQGWRAALLKRYLRVV
jgi:hypothetical protein